MDLLEFVAELQRDVWDGPIWKSRRVNGLVELWTVPQRTPIALLKAKVDQGVSAAGQQHLVCAGFVEGAAFDSDGGEVQGQGREGLENEVS